MNKNLFQFPGKDMNLEAAGGFDGLFADLGGDLAAEDPFGGDCYALCASCAGASGAGASSTKHPF